MSPGILLLLRVLEEGDRRAGAARPRPKPTGAKPPLKVVPGLFLEMSKGKEERKKKNNTQTKNPKAA